LARALDLHSRGQGFDSLILHEGSPSKPPPGGGERESKKKGRKPPPTPPREGRKGKHTRSFIVFWEISLRKAVNKKTRL
jgi:hypothetical protein